MRFPFRANDSFLDEEQSKLWMGELLGFLVVAGVYLATKKKPAQYIVQAF